MSQSGARTLVDLAAAGTVVAALLVPAQAGAESATGAAVQRAFTEFKSGLRHEDGDLACSRMTLRYRTSVLAALADQDGVAGIGCVTFIETYGREAYNEINARRLSRITVRGSYASASAPGTRLTFRRVDGRWRIDTSRLT